MKRRSYKKELIKLEKQVRELMDKFNCWETTPLLTPKAENDGKDWYRGAHAASDKIHRMILNKLN